MTIKLEAIAWFFSCAYPIFARRLAEYGYADFDRVEYIIADFIATKLSKFSQQMSIVTYFFCII